MTDKPADNVISKLDAKGKEPQKFVYLQLQQERLGDGSGRVTALMPSRGAAASAHFIPLTAKLNSISVLGSGARPPRPSAPLTSPRQQGQGTSIVSVATPRPTVVSTLPVTSTRSILTTTVSVSGTRPIITAPTPSIAPKPPKGTCAIRRTSSSVVVSSGMAKPVMSPGAATITVLGSTNNLPGASTAVFRPTVCQGAQPHGPVILHTSKVSAPVSTSTTASKMVSQRLLPIPISQVRTGATNKTVLSYSAIMQTGGSTGGSTAVSSKEHSIQTQPVLLQGAASTTVKTTSLTKGGPATISIITGKGNKQGTTPGTNSNPVNMLSVNIGQNKPMINFKISNGQIQADSLQQVDVLREARPLASGGKHGDERKENIASIASASAGSSALSHTLNAGTLTVTGPLTGSVGMPKCSELEITPVKQSTLSLAVKQPTLAASVDNGTDEELPSEVIEGVGMPPTGGRCGSLVKSGDISEGIYDVGQQNGMEILRNEDTKSSERIQPIISAMFQPVTTIYQPAVSLHQPLSNVYQLSTTTASLSTPVQQPLGNMPQTSATLHHPVTPTIPHPAIINQLPGSAHNHSKATPLQTNTRDIINLECDEKMKEEPEIVEGSKIFEEVRKEVLETLMSKSQDQFKSSNQHGIQTNDTGKETTSNDDKSHIDLTIADNLKNVVKIKSEDGEELTEMNVCDVDIKPELVRFSDLLKWEDGVGKLAGSNLKFRMNEFNAVEIVEDKELAELKIHHNKKYTTPTSRHHSRKPNIRELVKDEEIFSDNSQDSDQQGNKSTRESDDICCCKNCGCYGLSSEFFRDSSFCSVACGFEHDARELEWDKERSKLEKERQRRKRLKLEKAGDQDADVDVEGNASDAEESPAGSDNDSTSSKNTVLGPDGNAAKYHYPWQDGKNNFSWTKYLEHCGRSKGLCKAAPLKLWSEPFPFARNLFRPGMKLEAIDPGHQALFCVMTVAETIGFRLRLHFDGYSDQHDYWVNADSQNLFPVGWCEKNGRQLEPPLGVIGFSWKAYLEHCKAQAAPRHAFVNKGHTTMIPPNNFRVGMKLEAEDRKNMWVCVATVADVLDNRVLIHFDGWDKAYDVWSEVSSPYIHPIGWCAANNIVLHPPNDYPNPASFNWHEYLQETNSMAVPARAFKTRPPREFKVNMKLEAVDKRNPGLIRIATVTEVQDYQIKIHFDGWGEEYDYWVDDDCLDLHPPSWCSKTGYRLQPPLTAEHQAECVDSGIGCGIPGCKGIGHIKGPIYTSHHTAFGCPYSLQNLNKDPESVIPDRLNITSERKKGKIAPKIKLDLRQSLTTKERPNEVEESEGQKKRVRKRRKFFDELSPPEPNRAHKVPKISIDENKLQVPMNLVQSPVLMEMPVVSPMPAPSTSSQASSSQISSQPSQSTEEPVEQGVDMIVHQSVFNPGYNPHPIAPAPHSWERHPHLTVSLGDAKKSEVEAWNADQVQQMIARIPGCENVASVFTDEQIDGEALLMMTQNDLVSFLHIKLGPAIKIMAVIMFLRNSS